MLSKLTCWLKDISLRRERQFSRVLLSFYRAFYSLLSSWLKWNRVNQRFLREELRLSHRFHSERLRDRLMTKQRPLLRWEWMTCERLNSLFYTFSIPFSNEIFHFRGLFDNHKCIQSERRDACFFPLIRQCWIKWGSGRRNDISIGYFYMISISNLRGSPLKSIKSLFSSVTFIFMEVIWFMFFIFLIAVSSD